jgi:hypothetical protein
MTSRRGGDGGASLVLALVFLSLLSVFIVSVLSLGSVSFTNTVVTRTRADQLYAADGGVEYGIRTLATNPPAACQSVGSTFTTVGTQTINGKPVTVKCKTTAVDTTTQTTGGGSPLINPYAAIIGTGGVTIGGNNTQAPSFRFKGNVYSNGAMSVPSYTPASVDGNLELRTQACLPPNVTVTSGHTCTSNRPVPGLPSPVPTVKIPGTALAPRTVGSCTILYPGKYGSGGQTKPTFSPGGRYYLASGTYYFNDTGALDLRGEVFGGTPASTDTKQLTAGYTPCSNDTEARNQRPTYTAVGKGVTIILGGNADFRVQSDTGARIELYTRESPESGTTPGVTIWARNTAQGTTGYNPRHSGAALNTEQKLAEVVLHGLTYLPNNEASLNKEPLNLEAGGTSIFMGGLVAQKLTINVDGNNGSQPLVASIAGGGVTTTVTTPRKTTVEATAASTSGGAPTVVTAVIDRPTSAIETWRQS